MVNVEANIETKSKKNQLNLIYVLGQILDFMFKDLLLIWQTNYWVGTFLSIMCVFYTFATSCSLSSTLGNMRKARGILSNKERSPKDCFPSSVGMSNTKIPTICAESISTCAKTCCKHYFSCQAPSF